MKVLIVVRDGFTYRFTDLLKVEDHYLAHQIRDDNTVGKMEHKITLQEYNDGTINESDITE